MGNIYKDRVNKIRDLMKKHRIDFYIIPTNDYHGSEYVGDYFKTREFISGFTGSAGTLVISKDRAALFTDGRYYLQAEYQLMGSDIILYKEGQKDVKTIKEYIYDNLLENNYLGFDGRYVSADFALEYKNIVEKKNGNLVTEYDLVGIIWENRPPISKQKAYILEDKYSGENYKSKIAKVKNEIENSNTDVLILTALDEICWLFNIRGNDVLCNPVVMSYAIITRNNVFLYVYDEAIVNIKNYLEENNVIVKSYDKFYYDIKKIDMLLENSNQDLVVQVDCSKVNYSIYSKLLLNEAVKLIVNKINPTVMLKAKKNKIEIENEYKAHLLDGIAYAKFLYWFKDKENITELQVAEALLKFRKEMEGFVEESFESIVAYGKHGAIVHYSPNPDTNAVIEKKSFLLIDTGAHYLTGTTDVTRTLVCGQLSEEEKENYTNVLKGNLRLGNSVFLYGTTGSNIDILAREALWRDRKDYKHGTGHGIGYLLNVHEGPNSIRQSIGKGRNLSCVLEEGMITSNEPGLYITNKYGIRLENMMVCVKDIENEYGKFMKFDTFTLVPFDILAIDKNLLSGEEIELINSYHKKVYNKISPYLDKQEKEYFKEITREI